MELLLIRHGLPEKVVTTDGSPADPPLSAIGLKQAELVAEYLKDVRLDRLYSSPMRRAHQTAIPLAREQSLDIETEEKILVNIRAEIQTMTTLIITHRLSTIRNVDEIIVIKNGQIIERGNHADLARNDGYYEKIYKNQLLAREMEILMQ